MGWKQLIMATAVSAMVLSVVAKTDFEKAERLINARKPKIDYKTFCSEKKRFGLLMACRIEQVPSVGFLLCQQPNDCSGTINSYLRASKEILAGNVPTVRFQPAAIHGVKCADTNDLTCSGFLQQWIPPVIGWNVQLGKAFTNKNAIANFIKNIKMHQAHSGYSKTAGDLQAIRNFMMSSANISDMTKYKQICDLQGYFMIAGGFSVSDPSGVQERSYNDRCDDDDNKPTTQQVMDGLQKIIDALKTEHFPRSKAHSSSNHVLVMFISFFSFNLLFH